MSARPGEWSKFDDLCAAVPPIGPGARYIAVEFHCHTPASDDFEVGEPEGYKAIAERLGATGVDAVFVTDHNAWEGIAGLSKAVRDQGVATQVYPGVELTIVAPAARIGDGLSKEDRKIKPYFFHCLVFLPPSDQAAKQIETLVTDNFRNVEVLKQRPTERKLSQGLDEIARQVHEWGGLVLVAHFHQGKAPEKSRSHDDIYCDELAIQHLHDCFDAIEVRDEGQATFFDGLHMGTNGEVIPEKACVLGSDAHHPTAVGEEKTWLLVENNTFVDISTSLRYRERVRFQAPEGSKDVLLHLVTEGTFLGRCHFEFNTGLTALIGTKGAGKSAILECIRFALGVAPSQDVDKYLNHILGPSGRVWLSVRNRRGEEFLFIRARAEASPQVLAASGGALERNAVIPSDFPVEIRGWGEVTRLAEDKAAQLQLLDAFDPTGIAREQKGRIRELQGGLAEGFAELRATLDRLKETKTDLDQLELKKERLNKLVVGKIVDEQAAKEKRDSELASYRELLRVLKENEAIPFAVMSRESNEQVKSLFSALGRQELTPSVVDLLSSAMTTAGAVEAELSRKAADAISGLAAAVGTCIANLEAQFQPLEDSYQKVFAGLDPNEQDVLLARNEIIQEIARLPAMQGRFEQLSKELEARLGKYADRLDAIQAAIDERSASRAGALDNLNRKLSGAGIGTRLRLERYQVIKGNLPTGGTAATAFGGIASRLRSMSPLAALQRYFDIVPVSGHPVEITLEIDDSPAIEFELYPGVWRASEQLSAGQKSTAVLPLILMLGEGPVILDQPEDNLDNKYIGSTVTRMVLVEKARRQFIVTSHNATLVVMSDADLVIEMIDKEGRAEVVGSGFLNGPHSTVRRSVLEVLDGGEGALKRRFSKYGLKTP